MYDYYFIFETTSLQTFCYIKSHEPAEYLGDYLGIAGTISNLCWVLRDTTLEFVFFLFFLLSLSNSETLSLVGLITDPQASLYSS